MPMPADTPEGGGPLDLGVPQHIHDVGIGGAGMSAIALVLRAMGHQVTGSDLKDSPLAERLRSLGVTVAVGHSPENVADAHAVTSSPAVQPENPELAEARARGIRVVPRSEMLAGGVAGSAHPKMPPTPEFPVLPAVVVVTGVRPVMTRMRCSASW